MVAKRLPCDLLPTGSALFVVSRRCLRQRCKPRRHNLSPRPSNLRFRFFLSFSRSLESLRPHSGNLPAAERIAKQNYLQDIRSRTYPAEFPDNHLTTRKVKNENWKNPFRSSCNAHRIFALYLVTA